MSNGIEPQNGHIYVCKITNRERGFQKGKHYVYCYDGSLKVYTKRNVTVFCNGDQMLSYPGVFELAKGCPFCGAQTMDPFGMGKFIHHGAQCAREWDARMKKYCVECNANLVAGKCPNCG